MVHEVVRYLNLFAISYDYSLKTSDCMVSTVTLHHYTFKNIPHSTQQKKSHQNTILLHNDNFRCCNPITSYMKITIASVAAAISLIITSLAILLLLSVWFTVLKRNATFYIIWLLLHDGWWLSLTWVVWWYFQNEKFFN